MSTTRITIPADVPRHLHSQFIENMAALTKNTEHFFLFSCDQKIEHLNHDFYGDDIANDALFPEHLFRIANQGSIGGMAVPLGFLMRYGTLFPLVNYVAKLNGKTNIVPLSQKDPTSTLLWNVDDVMACKETSDLLIRGIGLTVYAGSEFEHIMLKHAAHSIHHAHQHGLVAILWMYPRGKALEHESFAHAADMCGLANALGADFVKIKAPQKKDGTLDTHALRVAVTAAGNTRVLCAGGSSQNTQTFLQHLHVQIHEGKTHGGAIGRNIFQKPLSEAVALTHAIHSIVYEKKDANAAWNLYQEKRTQDN